jgi:hypothetical protein
MDEFLKMDVFFVVATVAVVIIAAVLIVALVYLVRLVRTLNRIGEEVEKEAVEFRKDIHDAREKVRSFRFAKMLTLFGLGATRRRRKK